MKIDLRVRLITIVNVKLITVKIMLHFITRIYTILSKNRYREHL